MKTTTQHKKKYFLYLLMFLVGVVISSCIVEPHNDGNINVNNTRYSATEDFNYQIEVLDQEHLELFAINGSVEIIGVSDLDSVEIWGERRVESESSSDARAHLHYLSVEINNYSDQIIVQTKQPDKTYGRNYLVFYHIRIPADWSVYVENVNGTVSITHMINLVEVANTNGNLFFDELTGEIHANLTNGNIIFTDINACVVGNLTNGSISCQLTLPDSGLCQLNTVNGEISLSIPDSTSADFSAEVVNGRISITNLNILNLVSTPKSLSGQLGAGEGLIELGTVNGNIGVTGY